VSVIDELLDRNRRYAEGFDKASLAAPPRKPVAILACMDARLDPHRMLGLEEGDAHVLRNAGGAVTEDAIRSLLVSQRLLGTREVMLIHHTECGMQGLRDDDLREQLERETGIRPPFAIEGFGDVEEDVRQSIARVRANPLLPHRDRVRGFVYDVRSGRLREVAAGPGPTMAE
jgi:carbonic anhydrase